MATTSKFRKVIYSSFFGLGLTVGGASLASAAVNQQEPPTTAQAAATTKSTDSKESAGNEVDKNEADDKPDYTSSVTIATTPEGADEGSEADEAKADKAEQAKLEKVAKIDTKAAEAAATGKVPGKVIESELEEEDGNVVFDVEVEAAAGKITEVTVDAGNGKVLAQEAEDADEADEANEAPEAGQSGKESGTPTSVGG